MCVAAVAWQIDPEWPLVAIGNRDEFHARPTAPLARWDGGVLAGRDLQAGGTWLGVSEAGRFGLVTNFRADAAAAEPAVSRGGLVSGWLTDQPAGDCAAMNPFNLLLADTRTLRFVSNRPGLREQVLPAGIHGLSNGPFERPWAKTRALGDALQAWLRRTSPDPADLFAALGSAEPLPGEGPDAAFSGVMIQGAVYGTRCSTIVAVNRLGQGRMIERSFDPSGTISGEVALDFAWPVG